MVLIRGLDGLPEMTGSMDEAMKFVKDKLAGYPTTLDEDFALLTKSKVRSRDVSHMAS